MFDAVVLNGTVGAGKTTTAEALGALLVGREVPHAVIDLDGLRQLWPSPADDPFQHSLILSNVQALARNYRAAGATRLVLAGALESARELDDLRHALAPWRLFSCRLTVDPEVAAGRLRRLHAFDVVDWTLDWHLERSPELAAVLEAAAIDDAEVAVADEAPTRIAERVAALLDW